MEADGFQADTEEDYDDDCVIISTQSGELFKSVSAPGVCNVVWLQLCSGSLKLRSISPVELVPFLIYRHPLVNLICVFLDPKKEKSSSEGNRQMEVTSSDTAALPVANSAPTPTTV